MFTPLMKKMQIHKLDMITEMVSTYLYFVAINHVTCSLTLQFDPFKLLNTDF